MYLQNTGYLFKAENKVVRDGKNFLINDFIVQRCWNEMSKSQGLQTRMNFEVLG